jgi:heme/copper-type cytochrome/quinol oxidase subunit 2
VSFLRDVATSIGAGILSAILGWFAGYFVGELQTDQGLGAGLVSVWLMYVFAITFGIIGFVGCAIWRYRRRKKARD